MITIVNTVKTILDQTSNTDHSCPITIDALSGYSALRQDYIEQNRQMANVMREDAWGHPDIMGLTDQADNALEAVMMRDTELSRESSVF